MTVALARKLRSEPSEPERRVWALLWEFREGGWHFRRQAPIGPYIADFACLIAKLVIEVDGDTHGSEAGMVSDAERDRYMESRGFLVLRCSNREVIENPEGVFADIARVLGAISATRNAPTPVPSPQGGGRRRSLSVEAQGNTEEGSPRGPAVESSPERSGASPPPLRGRGRVGGVT